VSVSFARWVEAAFDHPVGEPEWYWGSDFESTWGSLEIPDDVMIQYLTQLFRSPGLLRQYNLDQVAQGIWFLLGEASPAQPSYALIRTSATLEARVACIRAMAQFFRDFVSGVAPGPAKADSDSFHGACYMWWDIFPCWGAADCGEPALHRACLDTLAEILAMPSELCRLSALHGLNHWHMHYPTEVERTVDVFLQEASDITPSIRSYAAAAREGCSQ
jgi:hypothetical protein